MPAAPHSSEGRAAPRPCRARGGAGAGGSSAERRRPGVKRRAPILAREAPGYVFLRRWCVRKEQETPQPSVRLPAGRVKLGARPASCAALRLDGGTWTACDRGPDRELKNGRWVCRRCLGEAQKLGMRWAQPVTLDEGEAPYAPPRHGGRGGSFRPPPPELAVQNRRRLHALMVAEGRIRPVDLEAAARATETGDPPPWTYTEAAALLEAPQGRVTQTDISGVWRGMRGISPGWTYCGEAFVTWPMVAPVSRT